MDEFEPGQIVMVRCDVVMTNDISGPVAFRAIAKMGAKQVFDPAKVVIVPDHFIPAKDTIGVFGGTNMALEFAGETAEALSIDERLAVANMDGRPLSGCLQRDGRGADQGAPLRGP